MKIGPGVFILPCLRAKLINLINLLIYAHICLKINLGHASWPQQMCSKFKTLDFNILSNIYAQKIQSSIKLSIYLSLLWALLGGSNVVILCLVVLALHIIAFSNQMITPIIFSTITIIVNLPKWPPF